MFKKWCSIENVYRQKEIAWWLEQYPELADETYVITEKIHGSSFQWYLRPHQEIQAGSRNQLLKMNGSFQGAVIADLLKDHDHLLSKLQRMVDARNYTLRLFGELYGKGIQKGVDYGEHKHVLYFGAYMNKEMVPFSVVTAFVIDPTMVVPVVGMVEGLSTALAFDTQFDSKVLGKPDNLCEGVVIQPYSHVYESHQGSKFLLKKKNEMFKEKASAPKSHKMGSEVAQLHAAFMLYITDNRLQSVFSKHGEIDRPGQIGDYIHLVLADAKEDFLKDHNLGELEQKQVKRVYSVGGMIAKMLKGYL